MRRFEIVPTVGTGADSDPIRPDVTGGFVVLGYMGNRALIKRPVADETAADNATIADLGADAQDVKATSLSGAQRTAIRNRLEAAGVDTSEFVSDGVTDRRALLRFLLRRWLRWAERDLALAISGFDVSDGAL